MVECKWTKDMQNKLNIVVCASGGSRRSQMLRLFRRGAVQSSSTSEFRGALRFNLIKYVL